MLKKNKEKIWDTDVHYCLMAEEGINYFVICKPIIFACYVRIGFKTIGRAHQNNIDPSAQLASRQRTALSKPFLEFRNNWSEMRKLQ